MLFILGGLLNNDLTSFYTWILFIFAICFLFPQCTLIALGQYIGFRQNKNYLKTNHFTISGKDVSVKSETYEATYKWEGFIKYHISDKNIILYVAPRNAFIFPRRCFPEQENWDKLSNLVKEKVKINNIT